MFVQDRRFKLQLLLRFGECFTRGSFEVTSARGSFREGCWSSFRSGDEQALQALLTGSVEVRRVALKVLGALPADRPHDLGALRAAAEELSGAPVRG
jgi:hypothetical protein